MTTTFVTNRLPKQRERIAQIFSGACSRRHICPVKDIVARFGDKWSVYTILLLGQHEALRFNELKSGIAGISQRMLTVTLRTLEEDGLLLRTQYAEIPPRVEYQLTPLGKSLLTQLLELASWADAHFQDVLKARKKYQKKQPL